MNDVEQRFAERTALARKSLGWSAQELANRTGISRVALSKIENNDRGVPLGDAYMICSAIGVPLEAMVSPLRFSVSSTIEYRLGEK